MTDILPCPFCGTMPVHCVEELGRFGPQHDLECDNIDCDVSPFISGCSSKKIIIKEWNERADGVKWPAPYDIGGDTEDFIQGLVDEADQWRLLGMRMMTTKNGYKNRLRELEKEREWLPIESAPLGEHIYLFDGTYSFAGLWYDGAWRDADFQEVEVFPTQWTSLPKRPEVKS